MLISVDYVNFEEKYIERIMLEANYDDLRKFSRFINLLKGRNASAIDKLLWKCISYQAPIGCRSFSNLYVLSLSTILTFSFIIHSLAIFYGVNNCSLTFLFFNIVLSSSFGALLFSSILTLYRRYKKIPLWKDL